MKQHSLHLILGLSLVPLAFGNTLPPSCAPLAQQITLPTPNFVPNPNPIEQLLLWEEKDNISMFQQPTNFITIGTTPVDLSAVNIQRSDDAPLTITNRFLRKGQVHWPQHPLNQSPKAPYFGATPTGGIKSRYTASRSLVIWNGKKSDVFSFKMPTNRPHVNSGETQEAKVSLEDDIKSAIVRTNYVEGIDEDIGEDPDLILLKEVLTVADKKTGNGFVVRDMRALQDGSYYLPAFSIPYGGRDIAKANGAKDNAEFEEFWRVHYAELLGRAKAKLLLRYGMQMETPNAQNMLLQLDRNLKPTGRLVFRDLSDSMLVGPVAQAIHGEAGYAAVRAMENKIDYPIDQRLSLMTGNSMWRLDEAGPLSVSKDGIRLFHKAHDRAYVEEIERALKLGLKEIPAPNLFDSKGPTLTEVQQKLFSPEGQAAIRRYHDELRAAVRAKKGA